MLKINVQTYSGGVGSHFLWIVGGLIFFFSFLITPSLIGQQSGPIFDTLSEARQHFNYREYSEATDLFGQIEEEICASDSFIEECVDLKIMSMNSYRNLNEFDVAEKHFQEGYEKVQNHLDEFHSLRVRLYTEKFALENEVTSVRDAGPWAERAVEIVEEVQYTGLTRADAYRSLGYYNDGMGNYDLAIENYSEALNALHGRARTIEVINRLAIIHNNIGISFRRLGKLALAMEHYQQNLDLVREAFGSNHVQLAYAYNSIGTVYYTIGDYGTAGDYFRRSADIFRQNFGDDSPLRTAALNNSAASFMRLNDPESALPMMQSVQEIRLRTQGDEHPDIAYGYSNLGSILTQLGEFDEALENHENSVEIRKIIHGPNHPSLVQSYLNISELLTRMGEFEQSRVHLSEARRIMIDRVGENHPEFWEIKRRMANSYAEEKAHEMALRYYSEAVYRMIGSSGMALTEEPDFALLSYPIDFMKNILGIGNSNLGMYKNGGEENHLHEAFYYFNLAASLVDYLQVEYQSEASKLNLVDDHYSIYTKAIESSYYLYRETDDEGWLDEILRLNEISRARIALELVQGLEARNFAGVPDDILEQERELNAAITNFHQQIHLEKEKGLEAEESFISEYRDSLFYATEELRQFTGYLEREYPEYYNLKYDLNPANRHDIQNMLGTDETLISYIVTDENLFAMIMDRNNLSVHKLGETEMLPELIHTSRQAITTGDTETYIQSSTKLYSELVHPIIDSVQTESVIIMPDQMLHFLPFEMLLSHPPENHNYHQMPFFLREKTISYTQSATLLAFKTNRRPSSAANLLAMAPFNQQVADVNEGISVSRYFTDLTPLPLTRYETSRIAEIFNTRRTWLDYIFPEKTEVLHDRDATKQRFLGEPLENYGYIHLATHAFVNESNPALSGIALWGDANDDGILRVGDIYNLQMNADLVVLGACETGLGRMYRGEGLIGFTRAFIYAGASNIVVSMWRVNDQPTAMLMIHFYEKIKNGYSYNEALQMAKLELINHPEFSAPRNWAAFILQGR